MFNYTDAIQSLQISNWPDSARQSLSKIFPRLGKWSIAFILEQIRSTGSEYDADEIAEIFSVVPIWYKNIESGDDSNIIDYVEKNIAFEDEIVCKALLAIILDIRSNQALSERLSPKLSKSFDELSVRYIKYVPPFEVVNMLKSRIGVLLNTSNIQKEIERYCYYRDFLQSDNTQILLFKRALENNEQKIGGKSIKFWINDFLNFAATSQDRSMYNVIQYTNNSKDAKHLNDSDKDFVSDILKLYNWIFKPYTTQEAIDDFEKIRFTSVADRQTQILPKQTSTLPEFDAARATPSATLSENKYVPPSVPVPSQKQPGSVMKLPNQYTANPGKIHDIVNQTPRARMGVVMDPTNVKLEDEKKRLAKDRTDQADAIAHKLEELRKRNNSVASTKPQQ